MTRRLDGRTAIVTGASRGLGRAIALALAAKGAAVAVVGRTEQVWDDRLPGTIGETVADIETAGGRAVAVRADLTVRDDVDRLVREAREALGPITILVNNAAFTAPGRPPKPGADTHAKPAKSAPSGGKPGWPPLLGTPLAAYRRHFEITVFASYELMQLVCPDMIDAGGGSIINITSVASRLPGDGPYPDRSGGTLPGYGGSKARTRAPDSVRGVRFSGPQRCSERPVTVQTDSHARSFVLRTRVRRRRLGGRIRAGRGWASARGCQRRHRAHDRSPGSS